MIIIRLSSALFALVALFAAINAALNVPITHSPSTAIIWGCVTVFAALIAIAMPSGRGYYHTSNDLYYSHRTK